MEYLLIAVALFLAFGNGANDNFKGFATVWGSESLGYRQALLLATLATLAGSLLSLFLASGLAQQFSGKGLLPQAIVSAPQFILSVGIGAALTVIIATRGGQPRRSTVHATGKFLFAALAVQPRGGGIAGACCLPFAAHAAHREGLRLRAAAASRPCVAGWHTVESRYATAAHRRRCNMRQTGAAPRSLFHCPRAGPPAYPVGWPDLLCARRERHAQTRRASGRGASATGPVVDRADRGRYGARWPA